MKLQDWVTTLVRLVLVLDHAVIEAWTRIENSMCLHCLYTPPAYVNGHQPSNTLNCC